MSIRDLSRRSDKFVTKALIKVNILQLEIK